MPPTQSLEWILLRRLGVLTICHLGEADQYVSELARKLGSNFSSLNQLLKKLESHGLIRFQRRSGRKYVTLTPQGLQVKHQLLKLLELLGSKL